MLVFVLHLGLMDIFDAVDVVIGGGGQGTLAIDSFSQFLLHSVWSCWAQLLSPALAYCNCARLLNMLPCCPLRRAPARALSSLGFKKRTCCACTPARTCKALKVSRCFVAAAAAALLDRLDGGAAGDAALLALRALRCTLLVLFKGKNGHLDVLLRLRLCSVPLCLPQVLWRPR